MAFIASFALLALACGSSKPSTPTPRVVPSAPTAPLVASHAEPLPSSIRDAMAAHGTLVGEPIHMPALANVKLPERWIAFVGTSSVARAAWASDAGGAPYPIEGWPVGVRVIAAEVVELDAYVLVETVGVVDQPKGLRGIIDLSGLDQHVRAGAYAFMSLGIVDGMSLHDAVGALRTPVESVSALAPIERARVSADALAHALGPAGADVFEVWQGSLFRRVDHVDASTLARSPRRDALLTSLRAIQKNATCRPAGCVAFGTDDGARMRSGAVTGLFAAAEPAPSAHKSAPRAAIASSAPSAESAALLRELSNDDATLVSETKIGTTTVAVVQGKDGARALLHDGDFATQTPLHGDHGQVAFLDADGDGTLDVLMGTSGRWVVDPISSPSVLAYRTNATLSGVADVTLEWAFVTMNAKTIDEARAAVLAHDSFSVDRAEACALLKTARTAGFRAVSTRDARFMRFAEPHDFLDKPELVARDRVTSTDVRQIDEGCADDPDSDHAIVCRGAVCGVFNYALGHFHLFARDHGKLKIAASAIYVGS